MPLTLSNNHLFLTKTKDVFLLCNDFFQSHPLHYFNMIRCYEDGSFFTIGTHAHFVLDWFKELPLISPYNEHSIHQHHYSFLWDDVIPEEGVDIATKKHHIYNGMSILYRYKDHFDIVSFAMPEAHPLAASYYLSSLRLLQDFYQDFLKRGRNLIQTFEKTKIILPHRNRDVNASKLFLNNLKGRVDLQTPQGPSYITSRELISMKMLDEGLSYKYIAQVFDVSPRTIETYISRAKKRTDTHHLQDIIKMLRLSENVTSII